MYIYSSNDISCSLGEFQFKMEVFLLKYIIYNLQSTSQDQIRDFFHITDF